MVFIKKKQRKPISPRQRPSIKATVRIESRGKGKERKLSLRGEEEEGRKW